MSDEIDYKLRCDELQDLLDDANTTVRTVRAERDAARLTLKTIADNLEYRGAVDFDPEEDADHRALIEQAAEAQEAREEHVKWQEAIDTLPHNYTPDDLKQVAEHADFLGVLSSYYQTEAPIYALQRAFERWHPSNGSLMPGAASLDAATFAERLIEILEA